MSFIPSSSVAGVKEYILVWLGGKISDRGVQVSGDVVDSSDDKDIKGDDWSFF